MQSTVDRPVDRISNIYDRCLTTVDRPVDRPKPRVWVCQLVDRSVDRNGGPVDRTVDQGTCTHAHPIGQDCG